jgi:hypothetical protein
MLQEKEELFVKEDAEDAPPIFEEGVQATIDKLMEVNNGCTKDD